MSDKGRELMNSAAYATDQAEQALQRAADTTGRDKLMPLAACDAYSNLSAAYSLRAIAEALTFPPPAVQAADPRGRYLHLNAADPDEDPRVRRCEDCKCCVGTYENFRNRWFCTECSDGGACPRQDVAKIKAVRDAAKVQREADNAAAELNRGHAVPNLDDRQRADLLSLRLLLSACNRMRDDWAESSEERRAELWTAVHTEADNVFDRYHERMSFLNRIDWADKMAPLDPRRTATAVLLSVHSVSYEDLPAGSRFAVEGDGYVRVRVESPGAHARESIRRLAVPPGSTLAQMLTSTLPPLQQLADDGGAADLVNKAADYVTGYHVQSDPVGGGESVTDLVVDLLSTRRAHGRAKYGTELTTNNGRDPLKDLQEELADALCYVTQAIAERGGRDL